jgi:uncharacterized membrane protein YkoI
MISRTPALRRRALAALASAVLELCALPAAQADRAGGPGLAVTQAAGGMSLDEAVDLAQRRFNARVVRADVSEADGRRVYVLRLLSENGRVWTVRVDAQSGAIQ